MTVYTTRRLLATVAASQLSASPAVKAGSSALSYTEANLFDWPGVIFTHWPGSRGRGVQPLLRSSFSAAVWLGNVRSLLSVRTVTLVIGILNFVVVCGLCGAVWSAWLTGVCVALVARRHFVFDGVDEINDFLKVF